MELLYLFCDLSFPALSERKKENKAKKKKKERESKEEKT
jgi:hypothetical protein